MPISFELTYEKALRYFLENALELLDRPVPPDPLSISHGKDLRIFEDLTGEELLAVERIIRKTLSVTQGNIVHRSYYTPNPESQTSHHPIRVDVFRGEFESNPVFLHELIFPDGVRRWAIGPDVDL